MPEGAADLKNLQFEIEAALLRRREALQKFGAGSPQFKAAVMEVAVLRQRVLESLNQPKL